jgi:hypothetical protein
MNTFFTTPIFMTLASWSTPILDLYHVSTLLVKTRWGEGAEALV